MEENIMLAEQGVKVKESYERDPEQEDEFPLDIISMNHETKRDEADPPSSHIIRKAQDQDIDSLTIIKRSRLTAGGV
jgi:cell fate regulator YaaT (PSP1 superfamily)